MQNKMVVLALLDSANLTNTEHSYSPSGYALALAVSNISRKFKQKSVQAEIEKQLKSEEELTYTIIQGSSFPLAVSDNLWECLSTLRVAQDDDLSDYDLELNDSEGGVIFRVEGVFTDKRGLLKGVSNFKSVADRLIDKDSIDLTEDQEEFIEDVKSNIRSLEELELALNEGSNGGSLSRISDEMEELLSSRKYNSEFRKSWEALHKQLLEGNSKNFIGNVPSHLLVEVESPFDVYEDFDESVDLEDVRTILEAQLSGLLPYQYGVGGSMYLHLQGSVLRENAYKQFADKGVRYDEDHISTLQSEYSLKPYLTYGEAVFLYLLSKGGVIKLPTTEIDSVFKSVLKVGFESQLDFLNIWFYKPGGTFSNFAEIYAKAKQISAQSYVKFCDSYLPFVLYFGFLYVLYSDNLFNCIQEGLPDFTSEIPRLEFAKLMQKIAD
jgi:hypothetical protein